MRFIDAGLGAVLDDWCLNGAPEGRACGHNLRDDERLDGPRGAEFEAFAGPAIADPDQLKRACIDHYHENVRVFHTTPETFTPLNAAANAGALSPEQKLVRLECLFEPLEKQGLTFDQLQVAFGKRDAESRALLDDFISQWNIRPDIRRNPISFAAFKDQLILELAADDWPDKLRDRLGLPHFNPIRETIPVALVEYEVQEIEAILPRPFYAPTALDGEPYSQFFPTPVEMDFGCPMALYVVQSDEDLVAELLHPRLAYGRQHVKQLGLIQAPVADVDFVGMRNNHVMALRLASTRYLFGSEL